MITMVLLWYMNCLIHALSSHYWTLQKKIGEYLNINVWDTSEVRKARNVDSYFISPFLYSQSVLHSHPCSLVEHFKSAAGLMKTCYFQ